MSSAVPLGSKPKKHRDLRKYLNDKKFRFKQYFLQFVREYEFKTKSIILLKYFLDVFFTGAVIWYAIHGQFDFIRYGLISALFLYYLEKSTAIIGSNLFRKKE